MRRVWQQIVGMAMLIGLVMGLSCGMAQADVITWNNVRDLSHDARGFYLIGAIDMMASAICHPDGITFAQHAAIVYTFAASHPKSWHLSATSIVMAAMAQAWPCPREKEESIFTPPQQPATKYK